MTSQLLARWLAAAAIAMAPVAHAAYSGLYVFGDSLSDSGNNAIVLGASGGQVISGNGYIPTQPYGSGTYSNGPVWTQYFAAALGLPIAPSLTPGGGNNFAFGGARTSFEDPATFFFPPSLRTQTNSFLAAAGGTVSGSALYVVEGGGNNARMVLDAIRDGAAPAVAIGAAAAAYAADIGGIVDGLQAAGARDIVVWNTPNIGLTPAILSALPGASALGTATALAMNAALGARLTGEIGVLTFDVFGLLSSPATAGFANLTDACGALLAGCTGPVASSYLFWDGIHPTTAGHAVLAQSMLALAAVPEPSVVALLLGGLLVVAVATPRGSRRSAARVTRIPAAPQATSANG